MKHSFQNRKQAANLVIVQYTICYLFYHIVNHRQLSTISKQVLIKFNFEICFMAIRDTNPYHYLSVYSRNGSHDGEILLGESKGVKEIFSNSEYDDACWSCAF